MLFEEYEQLLKYRDALARQQFVVSEHFADARAALEDYALLSQRVLNFEHVMWANCDDLCVEHDALLELRELCMQFYAAISSADVPND